MAKEIRTNLLSINEISYTYVRMQTITVQMRYVCALLNPERFSEAFTDWLSSVFKMTGQHICIDGKTMRGVKKLTPDAEAHSVTLPILQVLELLPIRSKSLKSPMKSMPSKSYLI
ncbi:MULTISPECIES: hypothetical protein [Bacteroidales]|uniref:hypothetical protein n=1 Tax=Bacteroidales TaxID=171549 RepID=UPI00359F227A